VRRLQLLHRLRWLSAGDQRLREEAARQQFLPIGVDEGAEDPHRFRGLAHLEMNEGQGLECHPVLHRRDRRLAEGLPSLGETSVEPLHRSQEQPALEKGGSIVALRGLGLALPQARFRSGDGPVERGRGVDRSVGGLGQEQAAEQEAAARS